MRVYVVYRGDEVVGIGTAEELAEKLDVKPETIRWYSTPVCLRRGGNRMMAVAVTVDENDYLPVRREKTSELLG